MLADADFVVGSVHQARLLHDNVTIVCEMMTNSSGQLDSVADPVQFEWTFLHFNSSKPDIILRRGDNFSSSIGSLVGVKYYRPAWTSMQIVSVDAKDVGTYTCTTPSGQSAVQDVYVLGRHT